MLRAPLQKKFLDKIWQNEVIACQKMIINYLDLNLQHKEKAQSLHHLNDHSIPKVVYQSQIHSIKDRPQLDNDEDLLLFKLYVVIFLGNKNIIHMWNMDTMLTTNRINYIKKIMSFTFILPHYLLLLLTYIDKIHSIRNLLIFSL